MSIAAKDIEATLVAALSPTALEVQDDSHLHAGHAVEQMAPEFGKGVAVGRGEPNPGDDDA